MRIVFFTVVYLAVIFIYGQNIDLDGQGSVDIQKLINSDSVNNENYYDYECAMDYYSKTNIDSAIFLIKMGIQKKGGFPIYSFLAYPVFYPFTEKEYLKTIAFADSVLNLSVPEEYLMLTSLIRHLYIDDQKYRKKMSDMIGTPNFMADSLNRIRFSMVAEEMKATDIENITVLDSLLNVFGKLLFNLHEIDPMSHRAVNLMILHADKKPEIQYKCVTKYKKEVIKNFGVLFYAVLYDRYLSNMKQKPKYYIYNPDNFVPDNLKKTNRLRRRLGLDPLIPEE